MSPLVLQGSASSGILYVIVRSTFLNAAVVLAVYTYRLVDESRKQHDLATEPDIGIYLDAGQLSHNLRYLVIHNIGQDPAHSVRFTIDPSSCRTSSRMGSMGISREISES